MPTRYLKPGIRDSEKLDRISALAEVLFYRLIVTVDDFGRYDARPAMVKSQCFPVRDSVTTAMCDELLSELAHADLIHVYVADGKPFLQMQKWDNKPRASESMFPAFSDGCAHLYTSARSPRTVLPVTVTVTGTETETQTGNRKPETGTEFGQPPAGGKPRAKKEPAPSHAAWAAYSEAYTRRYGAAPVRNAATNAQMAQVVARLGAEAPDVAAHYLTSNNGLYVRVGHAVGQLLRDAEKLRTEWVTGRQGTGTQAMLADRTQTNFNAFAPLLAEASKEGAVHAEQRTD